MARSTYDHRWQEAMTEINEQVHIEDHTLSDGPTGTSNEPPPQASIVEAFQHYASLYIKYIQILTRLTECYDQMVHPQKRIDVKQVIEVVATRVVELKHQLVKWNFPNPDVMTQPERSFPWEYVNLDNILVDLKLPPETIEIPISQSFLDDQHENLVRRDRLVKGYMKLKHGVDSIQLDAMKKAAIAKEAGVMSLDEAISVVQKNEKGRLGRQQSLHDQELREQERQRNFYETSQSSLEMDPDVAAANIQRMFRGFWSRATADRERDAELVFIGMKAPLLDRSAMNKRLTDARLQRRSEQQDNKEEYERALVTLHEVVTSEEGPLMKEKMLEERRRWITDIMATGQLPEDLSGFYAASVSGNSSEEMAMAKAKEEEMKAKADKKGAKMKKEDKKSGKGAKGKGKDVAIKQEEAPEKPPPLTGPSELSSKLAGGVMQYRKVWIERQKMDNFYQKYDVALAKDVVRGPVEVQVRQQVDEMLVLQLMNIKTQLEAASSRKKGKSNKGKAKKSKAKKGKKNTKEKGKKSKPLPGEKIAELKGRAPDSFLSILVDYQIVHAPRPGVRVRDFIGSFNLLGTILQHSDRRDRVGNWVPQDPSAAQLRQLITEYGVLPLSSPFIRARTPLIRSIMLYGPRGSGKTFLVSALANETGALLLNLSPSNLTDKFTGKNGPTKLVHMALMLAKATTLQPIIIYIDECEQMFAGNGKKTKSASVTEGPARFKKDLLLYVKTALEPSDRVLVVGTSSDPNAADVKDLRTFFDKFLYLPYPDYASRLLLWKHALRSTISAHAATLNFSSMATVMALAAASIPASKASTSGPAYSRLQDGRQQEALDLSTLTYISEGYASGSIIRAVEITLTPQRVECLHTCPLREEEFLNALSHQPATFKEDIEKFKTFTALITGLKETRDKIRKAAMDALNIDDRKDTKGKGDQNGKKGKK
ncbi:iq and aaa domain-containing [Plasmopara halstedii]|uniref:Iq and aaa domain-containing n=1 Tax=Plasmopara halstedii TaxID=4781 RepID=A0A0P1B1R4_PLAHL|nr:iq and aaa domain-containing [Plasmopara halstedii]CEG47354.1 iq and aaa domain-containing [Plasmopara halstedii]|eukprot:XP_024583723.1 iq and aaa domain-containing [Plasmopara halstedii]